VATRGAVQVRRIGVLMPLAEDHPVGQARVAAFVQELQHSGWTDGRNVRIDYRAMPIAFGNSRWS
jgi:hypothetical protein